MNDYMIAQVAAGRGVQLRMLVQTHCANRGLSFNVTVFDGQLGDNSWLFEPGYIFQCGGDTFVLSMRGHISRLMSKDPHDIARWIEGDTGLRTKISNRDDIIAYEAGTSVEIIDQILGICNSAAMPS